MQTIRFLFIIQRSLISIVIFIKNLIDKKDCHRHFILICLVVAVSIFFGGVVDAKHPRIFEVTPSTSADTGIVSVSFYGTNFSEGATVMLEPLNFSPVHIGSIMNGTGGVLLSHPDSISVSGNYAGIVNTGSHSIEIINISDPANPVHAGSIRTGSSPSGIAMSGYYAYIINDGPDTLNIYDISDPEKPVMISRTGDSGNDVSMGGASSIVIFGNIAYITGGAREAALEIVDITNPTKPVRAGKIISGQAGALLSSPLDVYKSGDYVYITSFADDALEIVDVSDPANPVHKGSIVNGDGGALLKRPISVWVSGNYAYVLSWVTFSLEIVDISDPAKPVHKSKLEAWEHGTLLDNAKSVAVSGDYAYVTSTGDNALEIIDISDPARPVHKTSINDYPEPDYRGTGANMNQPYGLSVSGDYVYVTSIGRNALEIADIGSITGTDVTVISPTQMVCTFNVTNKARGLYRVIITNSDGSQGVAPVEFGVGVPSRMVATQSPIPTSDPGFAIVCIGLVAVGAISGIKQWFREKP